MSKTQAHILFLFGDIFCLGLFWWGVNDIHQIIIELSRSVEPISFLNRIGFSFIGIGIPIMHAYAICEYFWRGFFLKRMHWVNISIIIFGIVLLAGAISISIYMQHYVEKNGYQYCSGASGMGTLAKNLVYTRDPEVCRRLTAEKRAALGLPPK